MKYCFIRRRHRDYERHLVFACHKGAEKFGDSVEGRDIKNLNLDYDGYIIFGCSGVKETFDYLRSEGKDVIFLDKGYTRNGSVHNPKTFLRVSVNSFQPTRYFDLEQKPDDRFLQSKQKIRPTFKDGQYIVFAGSTQKYADWHGLGDANQYAANMIMKLRTQTDKSFIYRPKPNWAGARDLKLPRTKTSKRDFKEDLSRAYCVVTHGSNAAVEAVMFGLPVICYGPALCRKFSSKSLDDLYYPTDEERRNFACNMAYCQYKTTEIKQGLMWEYFVDLRERFGEYL